MLHAQFIQDIRESLRNRVRMGFLPMMKLILDCLDFTEWLKLLCGRKTHSKAAYNEAKFLTSGESSFESLVQSFSALEMIKDTLEVSPDLSSRYLDSLKKAFESCVWGNLFSVIGKKCM